MDWLTDLLKHLSISRSIVVALFITSITMFFGARYAPTVVPPVPSEWAALIFGAMVLTGCLVFFWATAEAWRLFSLGTRNLTKSINSLALSSQEVEALIAMGTRPAEHIDLERIDYSNAPFTHLEFSSLMKSLEVKGLVHIDRWNGESAILTSTGRERALKLQREKPTRNAT